MGGNNLYNTLDLVWCERAHSHTASKTACSVDVHCLSTNDAQGREKHRCVNKAVSRVGAQGDRARTESLIDAAC